MALVSQGIASSGGFALSVLLVRTLGLERFGVLSLVLIGAAYAAGLGQALACQPLLSLAPLAEGEARRARVRDALWMAAGLAAIVSALAGGLMHLLEANGVGLRDRGVGRLAVTTLVGLRALAPTLRGALFTLGYGRATVAMDALGSWGPCVGVVTLGHFGGVSIASASVVLSASAAAACALALVALRGLGVGAVPGRAAFARHWQSGRWLAGNQVLSWFGTGGFHAATAAVVGPAGVGAIRAAQGLVGVLLVGCQALELILPGRAAAALAEGGRSGLLRWTRAQAVPLGLAFAALGAGLWLSGPWLIEGLFPGVDPDLTGIALAGLAWLPAASALTGLLQVSARALEDTRPVFVAYAVSALSAAVLALPLVEALGLAGAAWGFTGQQALFALLLLLSLRSEAPRLRRAASGHRIEGSVSIRHS
ncbi:hypothetical protein [Planctomycetes bacterium Poly30]|uniref:lipopolysaccharide biosynthesis protein n=1 Tax=Saltatorellus ferox TaxID=2528018 RepID=UPI0011A1A1D5